MSQIPAIADLGLKFNSIGAVKAAADANKVGSAVSNATTQFSRAQSSFRRTASIASGIGRLGGMNLGTAAVAGMLTAQINRASKLEDAFANVQTSLGKFTSSVVGTVGSIATIFGGQMVGQALGSRFDNRRLSRPSPTQVNRTTATSKSVAGVAARATAGTAGAALGGPIGAILGFLAADTMVKVVGPLIGTAVDAVLRPEIGGTFGRSRLSIERAGERSQTGINAQMSSSVMVDPEALAESIVRSSRTRLLTEGFSTSQEMQQNTLRSTLRNTLNAYRLIGAAAGDNIPFIQSELERVQIMLNELRDQVVERDKLREAEFRNILDAMRNANRL